MTDPERKAGSISHWVAANPMPAVFLTIGALMVLGVVLGRIDRSEEPPSRPVTTSAVEASATTTTATAPETVDPDRPEVDQLTCERLITGDEADAALFDTTGARGMFVLSQGETCRFNPDDESGNYIQIEPGDPIDFEAGTTLLGVTGEPVEGVGDAAVWFDDAATGILIVGVDVEIGSLIYRIHVGRSDLEEPGRLLRATELATSALPRFPFVEVEERDPVVVTFDDEPAGLPPVSLDEILYERIESGEWSLGEGLVAMLGWVASGDLGPAGADVIDASASGIIFAAQSYIADGGSAAESVQALLDELLPSRAELDARTIPAEAAASSLTVSLVEVAQESPDDGACVATANDPCYLEFPPSLEGLRDGKYVIKVAQPSAWTPADIQAAQQALSDAAVEFESLGAMPPTTLVMKTGDGLYAGFIEGQDCQANVGDFLAGTDPERLQQVFARELAICFINSEFFEVWWRNPNPVQWVVYGLANYLSGVVYPNVNYEHVNMPDLLAQQELSTTMPDRTYTNWIFFEHFHRSSGVEGVVDLIGGFSDQADLVAELSAVSGMPARFHDFELALSDSDVKDIGIGTVPYSPQAWELPITEPTEVPMTVPQFGVRRLHIQVQGGQVACIESSGQGEPRMSWRQGAPGGSGAWSTELPSFFTGEVVLVISSVEQGASYDLIVTAVEDSPNDCEEEEQAGGAVGDPLEELCLEICDPSSYFWGPLRFGS